MDSILLSRKTSDERGIHYAIVLWGQRHARYLKQHHKILYYNLLTRGKLNSYLATIDKHAEDTFFQLVKQIAEREGVTEALKAEDKWNGLSG